MTYATTTSEFDAFGPWIDVVTTYSEIPRLYTLHPIDFASARLVLKVPRNIARRDANPTMDLYDHLLIAGPTALTVLSRHGTTYTEVNLEYSEIAAVSESVNVLDGVLSLWSTSGVSVHIPFNGSGAKAITTLVTEIRTQGRPVDDSTTVSPRGPLADLSALGSTDVMLSGRYRALERAEPRLRLLAAEGRHLVLARSGLARLLRRTHVLSELLIGSTSIELHVLARHEGLNAGRKPDLSHRHTVVRLADVTAVASAPHRHFEGVSVVAVALGPEAALELNVYAGSECEKALVALG
jgi:hypothetical protein